MSDWALITEDASIERKNIPITSKKMLVGRESTCDIVIPKDEISRSHAEIEINGEVLSVKDLGSANGTFLNGKRIEQADANPGDELRFDIVVFKVDGPVVDKNKTVVRAAIDVPNMDTDATQVTPAISSPPSKPDIELANELYTKKSQIQAPITSPPPEPEQVESKAEQHKSAENHDKKTGVWQQTEETESGTLVMGVIDPITQDVPAAGNTATIEAIKYSLIGTKPPVQGTTHSLSKSRYIIGRTENNDITIDDSSVSSRHAELIYQSDTWCVNDLGSLNGVFINGEKVKNSALASSDTLWIGRVEFKFHVDNTDAVSNKNDFSTSHANVNAKKPNIAVIGTAIGAIVVAILVAVFSMKNKETSHSTPLKQPAQPIKVTELWKKQLSSRGTPSTPALGDIDGDKQLDVVVVDNMGWLRAFSGAQGNLLFEKKINGKVWAPPALHDLTGDGSNEIAIVSDSGDVYVFNGKGQQLWVTEKNIEIGGVYNRLALHDVNDDKTADVIVPSSKKGLVALDGNRGWELWNTASITNGMITSAPLITDLNDDGIKDIVMIADSGQILAVSLNGNRVSKMWEQQLPKVLFASPTFSKQDNQGLVIVATDKNGLIALDAKTGNRKWQANISGQIFASPIAVDITDNGIAGIIVVDLNGTVYAINSADGKELWQRSLGEKIQASPALFGGSGKHRDFVVLLDTAGKLHILNSSNGAIVSSTKISDADTFVASAVLGDIDNNTTLDIVFASQNANIFGYSLNYSLNDDTSHGQADWPLFLGNDSHGMY